MLYPNIEAERARLGKTKGQLAVAIGADPKTVANWQSGKSVIPCDKLILMCDLFGCTADYLLGREREKNRSPTINSADCGNP